MSSDHEVEEIRRIMADWCKATEERDYDRMIAHYHPDVVRYDPCVPNAVVGAIQVRDLWAQVLAHFPAKLSAVQTDIDVSVDGNTAMFRGMHRFIPLVDEEQWKDKLNWVRFSCWYKKIDGKWLVVHEHVSMSFNYLTGTVIPAQPN